MESRAIFFERHMTMMAKDFTPRSIFHMLHFHFFKRTRHYEPPSGMTMERVARTVFMVSSQKTRSVWRASSRGLCEPRVFLGDRGNKYSGIRLDASSRSWRTQSIASRKCVVTWRTWRRNRRVADERTSGGRRGKLICFSSAVNLKHLCNSRSTGEKE